MVNKVNLENIMIEMECANDTMLPFLDLETGEKLYIDYLIQSIEEMRNQLFDAIEGKGAFRRFKNEIKDINIEQQWYDYRDKEFKDMAIHWCNEHNLKYD